MCNVFLPKSGVMAAPSGQPIDLKLEVLLLGLSDVDRAKAFYLDFG
jgi:hypothetical protein